MSSTKSEVKWTPQFMEQFATEWLKHEILLPEPYTDGMSRYKINTTRSAAWREMFSFLGLPQYRPLQKYFLDKYKRMVCATVRRVHARCREDVLRVSPPWMRRFDDRFRIIDKVLSERATLPPAPTRRDLLLSVLRAMWGALQLKQGGVGGALQPGGGDVWGAAVTAAAEQCGYPATLIQTIWQEARTVGMGKLRLLQRAGDRGGAAGGALSSADWLAADMTLLYDEEERLVTEDALKDHEQMSTLTALFSLVQHCELDEWPLAATNPTDPTNPTDTMQKRWLRAEYAYKYSGRECSLVVLQRRWVELVHGARAALAHSWAQGRAVRPLHTQLAIRFPKLITERVSRWSELVCAGRVYTQDHIDSTPKEPLEPPPFSLDYIDATADDDDIILIERDIETIDLADLDSADETDKLIINEKLKMERLLPTQRAREKKEKEIEHQTLLEKRGQDICDNLDNELDSTLKDIIEQNKRNETDIVTSPVGRSLLKINNSNVKNEPKDSPNVEIDLTEESLDGMTSSVILDKSSLQTEIDLEETDTKDDIAITLEPLNKSPADPTHSVVGNLNTEMIESVLKELNEPAFTQSTPVSVFEQLDPSNVEAKIIFSDEDDDGSQSPDVNTNIPIQASTKDIQDHDLNKTMPVQDENVNTELENHIINLDTDGSDSESNKTVNIAEKEVFELSNQIKPDSSVSIREEPEQEKPKKKQIGPKSFMVSIGTPKKKQIGPKSFMESKETPKKKHIGPKSFMESLKRRNNVDFEENNKSGVGSGTPETELVAPSDVAKLVVSSDPICNQVPCKKEESSDDEDSTLIIVEDFDEHVKEHSENVDNSITSSKIKYEGEINECDKNYNVESRQIIDVKSDSDKTLQESNIKIKSESNEVRENTKEKETANCNRCKLSFEPDDAPISGHDNGAEPPALNTTTDDNANEAGTKIVEDSQLHSAKIDSKRDGRQESDSDENIHDINLKIKSEPNEPRENTKETETTKGNECKLSFEPDDASISGHDDDLEPAAMEVDEPALNTNTNHNAYEAGTKTVEDSKSDSAKIDPKSVAKQMIDCNTDITVRDTNLNIKSEPNEPRENTKEIEAAKANECKLSFESDDAPINTHDNNSETVAMEVDKHSLNIKTDDSTDEAITKVVEEDESKDQYTTVCAEEMPVTEDSKINTEINASDEDVDDAASEENLHSDRLVMAARVPLYRIDEVRLWKRPRSLAMSWVKLDGAASRLKPGLRPGWTQGNVNMQPVVKLPKLPIKVVHGYLMKQQGWSPFTEAEAEAEGGGRKRKRVELADIDEVRRVNRRLLTAQVKPITQASENDGPTSERGDPEAISAADVDNTLTPAELEEVLKKLKPTVPSRPLTVAEALAPKRCCLARRHISYNHARARHAARSGKQFVYKNLHALGSDKAHRALTCSCCCLSALKAELKSSKRLETHKDKLTTALRQLQNKYKGGKSAAPVSKPSVPLAPPPAVSDDSDDDDLPLIKRKELDEIAKQKKTQMDKKREKQLRRNKVKVLEKKKRRGSVEVEEVEEERERDEYDEYMRQKNMFAKYFTINPSSSTASSKQKNSVTVRPRVPNDKSKKKTKGSTLTKQMIQQHDQSQVADKTPTRNVPVSKSLRGDVNAPVTIDLTETRRLSQNETAVQDYDRVRTDHNYSQPPAVAMELVLDVQNTPTPDINPSSAVPTVIMINPLISQSIDSLSSQGTNQQKNTESPNEPPPVLANLFSRNGPWGLTHNIAMAYLDQNTQISQEPQDESANRIIITFPQPTEMQTQQQQSISPDLSGPASHPKQPMTEDQDPLEITKQSDQPTYQSIITVNRQQPLQTVNPLDPTDTTKPKQHDPQGIKTANQTLQPIIVQQPIPCKPPEPLSQPIPTVTQPQLPIGVQQLGTTLQQNLPEPRPTKIAANQIHELLCDQLTIPVETIRTNTETNQLHSTINIDDDDEPLISTNTSELETQTVNEVSQPTNDPKNVKVTKISGLCSNETMKLWNYSDNKVLLKSLLETSRATPGLKFLRVLHSPNLNETVMATCFSKLENPSQSSLQIITQPTDAPVSPQPLNQPSIRALYQAAAGVTQQTSEGNQSQTGQEKTLHNPADATNSSETNASNAQLNLNVTLTKGILQIEKEIPSGIDTDQGPNHVGNEADNSDIGVKRSYGKVYNKKSNKDHKIPFIKNLNSVLENLPSSIPFSHREGKVDNTDSSNNSKLNPTESHASISQARDSNDIPFTCLSNKTKNELSSSTAIYVEDLVKYVEQNYGSEELAVQILAVVNHQKMFKVLDRYLLVNEVQEGWFRKTNPVLSFWTLNPRLNLSQILFSKTHKMAQKRKYDGVEASEKPKLRVKEFAKLPPGVVKSGSEMRMGPGCLNSNDMFATDGSWYKKLSDSPLVYAQVLGVVETADAVKEMLRIGAKLHLLDLQGTDPPWPLHSLTITENGKKSVTLYCSHASEAMHELNRLLVDRHPGKEEVSVHCEYIGPSDCADAAKKPPKAAASQNVLAKVVASNNAHKIPAFTCIFKPIDSKDIPSNSSDNGPPKPAFTCVFEPIGSKNIPSNASNDAPPKAAASNSTNKALVSNSIPSNAVTSDNAPPKATASKSVIKTVGSKNIPSNAIARNNIPSKAGSISSSVLSNDATFKIIPQKAATSTSIFKAVGSKTVLNNVPSKTGSNFSGALLKVVPPKKFPSKAVTSNSLPRKAADSACVLLNSAASNSGVSNVTGSVIPRYTVGTVKANDDANSSIILRFAGSDDIVIQAAGSPRVLFAAGSSGSATSNPVVDNDVIVLDSDEES